MVFSAQFHAPRMIHQIRASQTPHATPIRQWLAHSFSGALWAQASGAVCVTVGDHIACPSRCRVLLISDQPIYRAGLTALLAGVPTIDLVGSVVLQAAAESIRALRPQLALWHASAMCGGGGIRAEVIRWSFPPARVVVWGKDDHSASLREAWRAGVAGWLPQDLPVADFSPRNAGHDGRSQPVDDRAVGSYPTSRG